MGVWEGEFGMKAYRHKYQVYAKIELLFRDFPHVFRLGKNSPTDDNASG